MAGRALKRRSVLCSFGTAVAVSLAGCSGGGDDDNSDSEPDQSTPADESDTATEPNSDSSETASSSGCGPGNTSFDSSIESGTDVTVTGVITEINTGRQLLLVDDGTAQGGVLLQGDAPNADRFEVGDCITASGQTTSTAAVQADVNLLVYVGDDSISTGGG